jgi:hypothetical protein
MSWVIVPIAAAHRLWVSRHLAKRCQFFAYMFGGHLWRLAIIAIDQFYVWLTSFHRPLSTCLHGCPRRCCSSRHGTRNPQELPKPASMVRPVSHQRLEARARPQEAIPSVFSIDSMASCDTRSQMSPCRTSSSSCHKLRGRREKDCAICIVAGGLTAPLPAWSHGRTAGGPDQPGRTAHTGQLYGAPSSMPATTAMIGRTCGDSCI